MTRQSAPDLLVLHAVRLLGFAEPEAVAARAGVGEGEATELLLDAQARGWVQHNSFAGLGGWFLTERGRAENERRLAEERAMADGARVISTAYQEFLPLNAHLVRACSEWQVRPSRSDQFAANDHTDPAWDARILAELEDLGAALAPLDERLAGVLDRFGGYHSRYAEALARVRQGEVGWVERTDRDSCHRVWFQLHEDLLATLGIDRQSEG